MIYPKDDPNGDRVLDLRGYEEYADNKPIILEKSATLAMRDIGLNYENGNDKEKIIYVIIPPNSRISDRVFMGFRGLQTVYNLNTCYRVDDYAFCGCYSLSNSNLSNCQYIGNSAFADCGNITFSDLKKCEFIGTDAFSNCTSLVNIECPNAFLDGNNSTGSQFFSCTSLQKIRIKSGITIPSGCFTECQNLQTVYNLNKCTVVYSGAFSKCYSLSNSDLSNCESIGFMAFSECRNITFSNLKKCTYMEYKAFSNCTSLVNIDCSNLVLNDFTTDCEAFEYCINLEIIKIHKLTKQEKESGYSMVIPDRFFYECNNLRIVNNLKFVDKIGEYAFNKCGLLSGNNRLDNCTFIGQYAFANSDSGDIAWNMPKCEELGNYAFEGSYTHRADISSINSIGQTPFSECRYLNYIKIPKQKYLTTEEFYTVYASSITIYNLKYVSGIKGYAFYNRLLSNNTILIDTNSNVDPDAFVGCQVQEWNLPNLTTEQVVEKYYFAANSGVTFHCKNGDVTVP